MNKATIEKLGRQLPLSKKRIVLSATDKETLLQLYAARVGNRDYDRTVSATPRKLATIAFGEALDALVVWKREVGKLDARGLQRAENVHMTEGGEQ